MRIAYCVLRIAYCVKHNIISVIFNDTVQDDISRGLAETMIMAGYYLEISSKIRPRQADTDLRKRSKSQKAIATLAGAVAALPAKDTALDKLCLLFYN